MSVTTSEIGEEMLRQETKNSKPKIRRGPKPAILQTFKRLDLNMADMMLSLESSVSIIMDMAHLLMRASLLLIFSASPRASFSEKGVQLGAMFWLNKAHCDHSFE